MTGFYAYAEHPQGTTFSNFVPVPMFSRLELEELCRAHKVDAVHLLLELEFGFIGESARYDVYLFYEPDLEFLKSTALTLDLARKLPQGSGSRLKDRDDPYRQHLDMVSAGRTLILEKTDTFTPQDVAERLCVLMLMLPATRRIFFRE
jgi:hypothetical protein